MESSLKIEFIKHPGGILIPANDMETEKMTKYETGEQYTGNIPLTRSPGFHRKVFSFFNFCFDYWKGDNQFQCETKQFNVFRNNLTVLAGFYDSFYNIKGEVRIEAQSLAFSNMSQEEFEQCYNALINAAQKHVFKDCSDNTFNQLMSFF